MKQSENLFVIVGTKIDNEENVQVDYKEVDEYCKENRIKFHVHTSVKYDTNIKEFFNCIMDCSLNMDDVRM